MKGDNINENKKSYKYNNFNFSTNDIHSSITNEFTK